MDVRVGLWKKLSAKEWCFWTVVLEKSLESPLDCEEIQPVHSKGDQSWVFIGRTDVEGETPILWSPDVKSWLIGKDPDAGKDWGQEEKGITEDEMVGWHHWLNGHVFGWTPGVGDEQGGLACCGSWNRRVRHDWVTELSWMKMSALESHSVVVTFQRLSPSKYALRYSCPCAGIALTILGLGVAMFCFLLLFWGLLIYFSVKDNDFTVLSWFLPYINMNQP